MYSEFLDSETGHPIMSLQSGVHCPASEMGQCVWFTGGGHWKAGRLGTVTVERRGFVCERWAAKRKTAVT